VLLVPACHLGQLRCLWTSPPASTRSALVPELQAADLAPGCAGVRAQAVDRSGKLADDFRFTVSDRAAHVVNVPSPAATASIVIGREIVKMAAEVAGL
jgi:L-2-hydroxyglutarate oxidase LhgO